MCGVEWRVGNSVNHPLIKKCLILGNVGALNVYAIIWLDCFLQQIVDQKVKQVYCICLNNVKFV